MDKVLNSLTLQNLRLTLYLVTPNETTYATMEDVPNLVDQTAVWMLLLMFLDITFLEERKFALNDIVTSLNTGLLYILFKFGGRSVSYFAYKPLYEKFRLIDLDPYSPWTWILCLFTQDFCYYLAHRAFHEVGIFWAFHQMHHSSEYFNLSVSMRQGAVQDLCSAMFELMQAFFMPPNVFLVHRYLCVLHQFWLHARLPELGPLEYFINTPSAHRVHHGRNKYCIDKNYGGTLIIWDRLFGTYQREKKDEEIAYGLVTPVNTFNQLWLNFFDFKAYGYDKPMLKNEKNEDIFPGFWNKVKAVFMPPGYFPGSKTRQFFFWRCMEDPTEGIPELESPVIVYNPAISSALKCYLFAHTIIMAPIVIHFSTNHSHLPWIDCIIFVTFTILRIQSFGFYFDQKSWAFDFDVYTMMAISMYATWTQHLILSFASSCSIAIVLLLRSTGQIEKFKTH